MEKGGYTPRRGGRGRGGQTRPYTQTVSLTINSYYYYIITIWDKDSVSKYNYQLHKLQQLLKNKRVDKMCSRRERFLCKAKGRQSGAGKVKLQFSLRILYVM